MQNAESVLPFYLPQVEPHREDGCCYEYFEEGLLEHGPEHDFSIDLLAWAIQRDYCALPFVATYLNKYDKTTLASKLKAHVKWQSAEEFYPILFFAVERNSPELVSLLCSAGASPRDRVMPSGLPVLVYCVISAEYGVTDITNTLIALLAAGADPTDVPKGHVGEVCRCSQDHQA